MKLDLSKIAEEYTRLSVHELKDRIEKANSGNPELLAPLRAEALRRGFTREADFLEVLWNDYKRKGFPHFFSKIDADDVQATIQFLRQHLPAKPTLKNHQLTQGQVLAEVQAGMSLQEKLQKVADRMRAHLMITKPIKILTIPKLEGGRYQLMDGLSCILVNDDMENQHLKQKIGILAHEMSHYYLIHQHGIVNPVEQENELLTEINAIFVGFGLLLLDGYAPNARQVGQQVMTSRVGYIDLQIIFEAIIQTAYARKQKPQWIVRNISFFWTFRAIYRLFALWRDYRKAKHSQANRPT